ncbi:MAG: hypothetical protein JXD22_15525 [Sedimentisphaerales bacterium]|nr:hypothetical protein [Sedimentisphaerales bacterium]
MNSNRRNIILLTVVLSVVAVLVGQRLGMRMLDYLEEQEYRIDELNAELRQTLSRIEEDHRYLEQWQAISEPLDKPIEERQQRFNTYLEEIEKESGVFVTSRSPFSKRDMAADPEFKLVNCSLGITCDLNSLVELLALWDADDKHLFRVESVSINPRPSYFLPGGRTRHVSKLLSTTDLTVDITVTIPSKASVEKAGSLEGAS